MHGSVTVHMAAPPGRIWELVSDVTRIGRYSPETFEAEWLEGATSPAVGVWRYRLEPAGDGTDVTESFELTKTAMLRLYWALLGWARGRTNRNGMRTTLERMKAEVE